MKESVNTSHDIRHFGHAEAFHTQVFAACKQVEDFKVTFSIPFCLITSSVTKFSMTPSEPPKQTSR
jgi:hypothetical protein